MSFSSGTKTAIFEAASWAIAGVMLAATFVYFDELKAAFAPVAGFDAATQRGQQRAPKTNHRNQTQPVRAPRRQAAHNSPGYLVKLKAGSYGHYKTAARVNGRQVNVLVDTGASYVALTHEDAARAGVFVRASDFKHRTQTANGQTRVAIVNIDRISIGDIEVRNVRATVHERGKLNITLLGMSFLGKLRRAEMRRGELILEN